MNYHTNNKSANLDPLCGRYEGEAHNGMTRYVEFSLVEDSPNSVCRYTYGFKGLPPIETKHLTPSELAEKVQNVLNNGYVKVYQTIGEEAILAKENALGVAAKQIGKGFSFNDWAENK